LLAALARSNVTVALSGDGGDEVFGGYTRYADCARLWRRSRLRLGHARREELYLRCVSRQMQPNTVVRDASEPNTVLSDPAAWVPSMPFLEWMMTVDQVTFLPDYILTKVDRATMAVSLESRAPFLDHRVVELASGLQANDRLRRGRGKPVLRALLKQHLPAHLVDRPKMGFDPPLSDWLRGPLRDWAEHLLSAARLRADGYLEPVPVRSLWAAHLAGREDEPYALWALLMFQSWLDARR
jgi:asparagine synthase (glutamine-hydrolysing)